MAIEYNLNDLQKRRRTKKVKKFAKKLIVVAVIAALGVTAYLLRDKWIPLFEGIGTRYSNAIQNSGELAEGCFPIVVSAQSDYQTVMTDTSFTYLDDTHFNMYSADGELLAERQHGYSAPILKAGGKRALIYDSGGKKMRVESKQKTVFEKTTDGNIILSRISGNDMTAIITESESFACVMNVYNADGSDCYMLKNADGRIIDMTFRNANDGCVVSNIGTVNGGLVSTVYSYSFNKQSEDWATSPIDTMIFSLNMLDNGTVAAIGDTKCVYISADGSIIGEYIYPSALVDYDCDGEVTAFLFKNESLRKNTAVIISDISSPGINVELSDNAKSIDVEGTETFILTSKGITEYSPDGAAVMTVPVSDDYIDFVKSGDFVFLKGYSEINRIDFIS